MLVWFLVLSLGYTSAIIPMHSQEACATGMKNFRGILYNASCIGINQDTGELKRI